MAGLHQSRVHHVIGGDGMDFGGKVIAPAGRHRSHPVAMPQGDMQKFIQTRPFAPLADPN